MKVICDINVIRSTSISNLEPFKDILHVPKLAVDELLTSKDWSDIKEHGKLLAAIEKIKFLKKEYSQQGIRPVELILSASGVHSLPPLATTKFQEQNFDALLGDFDGMKETILQHIINKGTADKIWEELFPGAVEEVVKKAKSDENFLAHLVNNDPFHKQTDYVKNKLREFAKDIWTWKVKLFIEKVHNGDSSKILHNIVMKYGHNNLIIDVWAAYLKYRILGQASVNDQFDINYAVYLYEGDKLWTNDNLTKKILSHELGRGDLIFDPKG